MSTPLIVIGSGGHARVLIEALQLRGVRILGALDRDPARRGQSVLGVPILGGDEVLAQHAPGQLKLVCGVGSVAPGSAREVIHQRWRDRGYEFEGVLHPSAVVARDVRLRDAQVMAAVVIQPGVELGANVILNTACVIDHDCAIGDHAHISPGATLCGAVRIGRGAHVGAGATVVQGIEIGEGAFVYAGAVVTRAVPARIRVAGVPAREVAA
jgi:UDP-perosamine 4-acetyltransferase